MLFSLLTLEGAESRRIRALLDIPLMKHYTQLITDLLILKHQEK